MPFHQWAQFIPQFFLNKMPYIAIFMQFCIGKHFISFL